MLTWSHLRSHLDRCWRVVTGDDDWVGLLVDTSDVEVRLVVKATADAGRVIVAAQVCPSVRVASDVALRYNAASTHGMLMLEEDTYALRQLVSLAQVDAGDLDEVIGGMAGEAARLRALVAPPPAGTGDRLFELWCS